MLKILMFLQEKMKLKICSRLMELGSNAEQPKNINISDYSRWIICKQICLITYNYAIMLYVI